MDKEKENYQRKLMEAVSMVPISYKGNFKGKRSPDVSLTAPRPPKERNPLDWYSLTYSANSILNGLVALSCRERLLEKEKPIPDLKRIGHLKKLSDEAWEVLRDNAIFFSLEKMEETIEKYSPILLAEKKIIHKRLDGKL